jgi:hypothetical protein
MNSHFVNNAALLCMMCASASASEADRLQGLRLQFDNDLLSGQERDQDYTGGFTITRSGPHAGHRGYVAHQIGFMTFTPVDVTSADLVRDDRPYASLLFVASSRTRLDADESAAWFTSVSIGALGLPLAEQLHNTVHQLGGSPATHGYSHQISAGGELTARYVVARQSLLFANASGNLEVKGSWQASVGYLTEGSAALSLRVGNLRTPWWTWAPELTDYTAAPTPTTPGLRGSGSYFCAGVRLKARVYNAFLQGQFRHSEHRYSSSELEPALLETWAGFASEISERTQVGYTLNYQSAELRDDPAARSTLWAAVQINHRF